jgi:hypothetical protein
MTKAGRGSGGAPKKKKGKTMQMATGNDPNVTGEPRIDSRIQHEIGKHLRAHYDDVINEPVPDRIMDLLQKLEKSVTQKR